MKNTLVQQHVHDIRNNLNRISMQAELIKLVLEVKEDEEKIAINLDKILDACVMCHQPLTAICDDSYS